MDAGACEVIGESPYDLRVDPEQARSSIRKMRRDTVVYLVAEPTNNRLLGSPEGNCASYGLLDPTNFSAEATRLPKDFNRLDFTLLAISR